MVEGTSEYPEIDFGTRECKLCNNGIPAQRFGYHITEEHSREELGRWPGGMNDLEWTLRSSLIESIKRAEGYPEVQKNLRTSLYLVQEVFDLW